MSAQGEIVGRSAWMVPDWSDAELAILRRHFAFGGSRAVLAAGVKRSDQAIRKKAAALGVKCERLSADLTGKRYGMLVALAFLGPRAGSGNAIFWRWRCDCGREKVIPSKDVTRTTKPTLNCGCARRVEGRRYASRKSWGDNVILHYGNKCQICGWAEARCDVHHRIPRSEGGPHTLANAVVLCPNCHRVQHEKERRCER
jgi:hypothetical protein